MAFDAVSYQQEKIRLLEEELSYERQVLEALQSPKDYVTGRHSGGAPSVDHRDFPFPDYAGVKSSAQTQSRRILNAASDREIFRAWAFESQVGKRKQVLHMIEHVANKRGLEIAQ